MNEDSRLPLEIMNICERYHQNLRDLQQLPIIPCSNKFNWFKFKLAAHISSLHLRTRINALRIDS